jgi:hypothetical protein
MPFTIEEKLDHLANCWIILNDQDGTAQWCIAFGLLLWRERLA